MKRIFKKNQIVIFVIGLMLITAGYLNFTNTENNKALETAALADAEEMASLGDARLVSSGNIVELNTAVDEESTTENNLINEVKSEEGTISNNEEVDANELTETNSLAGEGETIDTGAINADEYFTTSKLERETMYSQRIENYQEILNNANVSEAQKKLAQEEITAIGEEQNAIMIAENLIKTKGIDDLIIFVNGESINVIVKGDDLEKDEIAQMQNIITRELEADISNIHIMNKK